MTATVRDTTTLLLESIRDLIDQLLALPAEELPLPSSHACAQGKDLWALLTNNMNHDAAHAGQVLEARYESRVTASPIERLAAELFVERARFISTFLGMTDEQFQAQISPDGWTYGSVARHLIALDRDSMRAVQADIAGRRG